MELLELKRHALYERQDLDRLVTLYEAFQSYIEILAVALTGKPPAGQVWGDPTHCTNPHPAGCTTMNCAWQNYGGSLFFGYVGGPNAICDLDGVQGYCGSVLASVQNGSAAFCPNNNCIGVQVLSGSGGQTVIQQWVPPLYWGSDGVLGVQTGYWSTVGTVQNSAWSDLAIGGASFTPQGGSAPGQIETLAKGLNALTTPFQNIAVSAGLLLTGAGTIVGAAVATDAVCAAGAAAGPAGWAGCAGFVVFGTVPTMLGGAHLISTGYQYTKDVTIPSITNFGR